MCHILVGFFPLEVSGRAHDIIVTSHAPFIFHTPLVRSGLGRPGDAAAFIPIINKYGQTRYIATGPLHNIHPEPKTTLLVTRWRTITMQRQHLVAFSDKDEDFKGSTSSRIQQASTIYRLVWYVRTLHVNRNQTNK